MYIAVFNDCRWKTPTQWQSDLNAESVARRMSKRKIVTDTSEACMVDTKAIRVNIVVNSLLDAVMALCMREKFIAYLLKKRNHSSVVSAHGDSILCHI